MSNTRSSLGRFIVKHFDGKGSFTLWERRVKDILVQRGLEKASKEKDRNPEKMIDAEWYHLV